ncbi:hypothetical protein D3C81_1756000 [compost metagenome]
MMLQGNECLLMVRTHGIPDHFIAIGGMLPHQRHFFLIQWSGFRQYFRWNHDLPDVMQGCRDGQHTQLFRLELEPFAEECGQYPNRNIMSVCIIVLRLQCSQYSKEIVLLADPLDKRNNFISELNHR